MQSLNASEGAEHLPSRRDVMYVCRACGIQFENAASMVLHRDACKTRIPSYSADTNGNENMPPYGMIHDHTDGTSNTSRSFTSLSSCYEGEMTKSQHSKRQLDGLRNRSSAHVNTESIAVASLRRLLQEAHEEIAELKKDLVLLRGALRTQQSFDEERCRFLIERTQFDAYVQRCGMTALSVLAQGGDPSTHIPHVLPSNSIVDRGSHLPKHWDAAVPVSAFPRTLHAHHSVIPLASPHTTPMIPSSPFVSSSPRTPSASQGIPLGPRLFHPQHVGGDVTDSNMYRRSAVRRQSRSARKPSSSSSRDESSPTYRKREKGYKKVEKKMVSITPRGRRSDPADPNPVSTTSLSTFPEERLPQTHSSRALRLQAPASSSHDESSVSHTSHSPVHRDGNDPPQWRGNAREDYLYSGLRVESNPMEEDTVTLEGVVTSSASSSSSKTSPNAARASRSHQKSLRVHSTKEPRDYPSALDSWRRPPLPMSSPLDPRARRNSSSQDDLRGNAHSPHPSYRSGTTSSKSRSEDTFGDTQASDQNVNDQVLNQVSEKIPRMDRERTLTVSQERVHSFESTPETGSRVVIRSSVPKALHSFLSYQ